MNSTEQTVDEQWYKRAFSFEITIEEACLDEFFGTDDGDPLRRLKIGETKIYASQTLRLLGTVRDFTRPEVARVATPDFVNSRVSLDVNHVELTRGPDGLFDYGCL